MIERTEIQRLSELPIESVASRLGLNVSRHHCLCPFHKDSHPSLSFDRRRNRYRCFVCGAHGGAINLVMELLNKNFVDACKWLANENNIILTEYKPLTDRKDEKEKAFDPNKYLKFFEHPFLNDAALRFLYDERKIDPRVVKWCRLTSWTDRNGTSWLQIPYYDENNKLTGIQNRRLTTSPPALSEASPQPSPKGEGVTTGNDCRFMFPRGSRCGIYNLPVLKLLKPGEPLYIAEGCSDCWALLSSGHKAIAIPSATLLKAASPIPLQREGANQLGTTFHMYPDQDEPGERLFLQLKELLSKQFAAPSPSGRAGGEVLIRHQLPPDCKDYAEYYKKIKR